jgi:hypothetical protein
MNILAAISASFMTKPGIIPSKSTPRQERARATLRAGEEGTLAREAGLPIHITLTTLR